MTPQDKIAALRAKAAANRAKLEGKVGTAEATSADNPRSEAEPVSVVPQTQTQPKVETTEIATIPTHSVDVTLEPFKMKLAELEQALTNELPGFPLLLRDIHREMQQDPNVVTIMTPEEIGLVVKGLTKHMDVTVIAAKPKSTKRTQPITADEL